MFTDYKGKRLRKIACRVVALALIPALFLSNTCLAEICFDRSSAAVPPLISELLNENKENLDKLTRGITPVGGRTVKDRIDEFARAWAAKSSELLAEKMLARVKELDGLVTLEDAQSEITRQITAWSKAHDVPRYRREKLVAAIQTAFRDAVTGDVPQRDTPVPQDGQGDSLRESTGGIDDTAQPEEADRLRGWREVRGAVEELAGTEGTRILQGTLLEILHRDMLNTGSDNVVTPSHIIGLIDALPGMLRQYPNQATRLAAVRQFSSAIAEAIQNISWKGVWPAIAELSMYFDPKTEKVQLSDEELRFSCSPGPGFDTAKIKKLYLERIPWGNTAPQAGSDLRAGWLEWYEQRYWQKLGISKEMVLFSGADTDFRYYNAGPYKNHYSVYRFGNKGDYGESRGFQIVSEDADGNRRLEGWITYIPLRSGNALYLRYSENAPWNRAVKEGKYKYSEVSGNIERTDKGVEIELAPRELIGVNSILMARLIQEAKAEGYHGQVCTTPETKAGANARRRMNMRWTDTGLKGEFFYYRPDEAETFVKHQLERAAGRNTIPVVDITNLPEQLALKGSISTIEEKPDGQRDSRRESPIGEASYSTPASGSEEQGDSAEGRRRESTGGAKNIRPGDEGKDKDSLAQRIIRESAIIEPIFFEIIKKKYSESLEFCVPASYVLSHVLSRRLKLPIGGQASERIEMAVGLVTSVSKGDTPHAYSVIYINDRPSLYVDAAYEQFKPKYHNRIYAGEYATSIDELGLLTDEEGLEYLIRKELGKIPEDEQDEAETEIRRDTETLRNLDLNLEIMSLIQGSPSRLFASRICYDRIRRFKQGALGEMDVSKDFEQTLNTMIRDILSKIRTGPEDASPPGPSGGSPFTRFAAMALWPRMRALAKRLWRWRLPADRDVTERPINKELLFDNKFDISKISTANGDALGNRQSPDEEYSGRQSSSGEASFSQSAKEENPFESDNLWGRPGRVPTKPEKEAFQQIFRQWRNRVTMLDLAPLPKLQTREGLDGFDIYQSMALGPDANLEPLEKLEYIPHTQLGSVIVVWTGHFAMARVDEKEKIAFFSGEHASCTVCAIRAVDKDGGIWVGLTHILPSERDMYKHGGEKGDAFDQLISVLGYLKEKDFARVTIQMGVDTDELSGIPPVPELEEAVKRYGFDVLPTIIRSKDDLRGDTKADVLISKKQMIFRQYETLSVKDWKIGDGPKSATSSYVDKKRDRRSTPESPKPRGQGDSLRESTSGRQEETTRGEIVITADTARFMLEDGFLTPDEFETIISDSIFDNYAKSKHYGDFLRMQYFEGKREKEMLVLAKRAGITLPRISTTTKTRWLELMAGHPIIEQKVRVLRQCISYVPATHDLRRVAELRYGLGAQKNPMPVRKIARALEVTGPYVDARYKKGVLSYLRALVSNDIKTAKEELTRYAGSLRVGRSWEQQEIDAIRAEVAKITSELPEGGWKQEGLQELRIVKPAPKTVKTTEEVKESVKQPSEDQTSTKLQEIQAAVQAPHEPVSPGGKLSKEESAEPSPEAKKPKPWPEQMLTEDSIRHAAAQLGFDQSLEALSQESSRGAWILAVMLEVFPELTKGQELKGAKIFELGGSGYHFVREYLQSVTKSDRIFNVDYRDEPKTGLKVPTIPQQYHLFLPQIARAPDVNKPQLIFSLRGIALSYAAPAIAEDWELICNALQRKGRAIMRPHAQVEVFGKSVEEFLHFSKFLNQFGVEIEKIYRIPYSGIGDERILVLKKISDAPRDRKPPQPDVQGVSADGSSRKSIPESQEPDVQGVRPKENNRRTTSGGEIEMDAIVRSMLSPPPLITEPVLSYPIIQKIDDIGIWKHLQKTLGFKGYAIGHTLDIAAVQAKLWKQQAPEASSEEYWQVRSAFEREIPLKNRFRMFVYEPFDHGAIEFHENLHYLMFARAVEAGTYISQKGGRDILFDVGTESGEARNLHTLARQFPDAERAFEDFVSALRTYPEADLSQELFTWIYSIDRYLYNLTLIKAAPGSEESRYLEAYLKQAEGTAGIARHRAKAFLTVARRHPEIMRFLNNYYRELRAFSGTMGEPLLPQAPWSDSARRSTAGLSSDEKTVKEILQILHEEEGFGIHYETHKMDQLLAFEAGGEPLSQEAHFVDRSCSYLLPYVREQAGGNLASYKEMIATNKEKRGQLTDMIRVGSMKKKLASYTSSGMWIADQGEYIKAALEKKLKTLELDGNEYHMRIYFAGVGTGQEIAWSVRRIKEIASRLPKFANRRIVLHVTGGDLRLGSLYRAEEHLKLKLPDIQSREIEIRTEFEWIDLLDPAQLERLQHRPIDCYFLINTFYLHFVTDREKSNVMRRFMQRNFREAMDVLIESLAPGAYLLIENTEWEWIFKRYEKRVLQVHDPAMFSDRRLRLLSPEELLKREKTDWTGIFVRIEPPQEIAEPPASDRPSSSEVKPFDDKVIRSGSPREPSRAKPTIKPHVQDTRPDENSRRSTSGIYYEQTIANIKGGPEVTLDYSVGIDKENRTSLIVAGNLVLGDPHSTRPIGNFAFTISHDRTIEIKQYFPIGQVGSEEWKDNFDQGISQTFLFWLSQLAHNLGVREIRVTTPWLINLHVFSKFFADEVIVDGTPYSLKKSDDIGIFDSGIIGDFEISEMETGSPYASCTLSYQKGTGDKYEVAERHFGQIEVGQILYVNKGIVYEDERMIVPLGFAGRYLLKGITFRGIPKIPETMRHTTLSLVIPQEIADFLEDSKGTPAKESADALSDKKEEAKDRAKKHAREEHIQRLQGALFLREQVSQLPDKKSIRITAPTEKGIEIIRSFVANNSQQVVLVIDGDPGTGKSEIAEHIAEDGLGLGKGEIMLLGGDWVPSTPALAKILMAFRKSGQKVLILEGVSSTFQYYDAAAEVDGFNKATGLLNIELPYGFEGPRFSSRIAFKVPGQLDPTSRALLNKYADPDRTSTPDSEKPDGQAENPDEDNRRSTPEPKKPDAQGDDFRSSTSGDGAPQGEPFSETAQRSPQATADDIKELSRQMNASMLLDLDDPLEHDKVFGELAIVVKEDLTENSFSNKEAILGATLRQEYKVMMQGLEKLIGRKIETARTSKELEAALARLIAEGRKVVVIDDGELKQGLRPENIKVAKPGEAIVTAKPGADYSIIIAEQREFGANTMQLLNLNAMALMGAGLLYNKAYLFEKAYRIVAGDTVNEAYLGELVDMINAERFNTSASKNDSSTKKLWYVEIVPRAVSVDHNIFDHQKEIRQLFASAV